MSVLLLVRHGQASFGKSDYDALSTIGHEQSRILGRALAERGVVPDVIIRGELRRHRETADGILAGIADAGLGVPADIPVEVDPGWDEFDFDHVVEVFQPLYRSRARLFADHAEGTASERRARFQALFEDATERWTGGTADADYRESFPAFSRRVNDATHRAAGRSERTALVVSSGGPIGLVASHLLAGDASLWASLNRVAVNAAVTKIVRGRAGLTLSTYNEHGHLEHDRQLVTYR